MRGSALVLSVAGPVFLFWSSGCASTGASAGAPTAAMSATPERARLAFERFKALDGEWDTRSTKGWGGRIRYQTITGGACVMQTDAVAHEGDTMVTMIHPDGQRLLLTHYCAARNQPRLVATKINEDASEVTFEFLDGTNLPSRDAGHMDKVVFRFKSPDEFTDRWTWYQKGEEKWMEDITNLRVKGGAGAGGGAPRAARRGGRPGAGRVGSTAAGRA